MKEGDADRRVRIVQYFGGTKREHFISEQRARHLGIDIHRSGATSVPYLLGDIFVRSLAGGETDQVCPRCGTRHQELVMNRTVGCEECYAVFGDTIETLLEIRASNYTHSGKVPPRLRRYRALFIERERILRHLEVAVEEEDYESAAELRDQLSKLAEE
ncbi:MAG: UvrB/UvrC motif-containing protein [Alkalispirochaetaceae bacterium]